MHKIFARATLLGLRPEFFLRPLYTARFSNRRAEDATALCYQRVSLPSPPRPSPPRHTTKLFPHAQFADDNAPCHGTLACRTSRAPVCLFSLIALPFLNAELSPSALPPVPPSPPPSPSSLVAAVSRPSSFISSVILAWRFPRSPFLPCNHIHPGEYRAPSFRGSRLC